MQVAIAKHSQDRPYSMGDLGTALVSVLIVSYRTRELTLSCLNSIFAASYDLPYEVIIIDNASSDGSAEAIAEQYPQARLVALTQNIGFAAATQMAANMATGRYFLLLNPDTVVLNEAIKTLYSFAEARSDAGIYGGRTLNADMSLNPQSCWGRPTLWSVTCQALGLSALGHCTNWFNPEAMGAWRRDTVREVDIVSGCFLMIRSELWRKLGGFDRDFFMYGEDTDLCLRARQVGARCLICPDATIIHYAGASERVRADKMIRLFIAKRKLFRKHWCGTSAALGIWMLGIWVMTRLMAFRIASEFNVKYLTSYGTWQAIWNERSRWLGRGNSHISSF